MDLGRLTVGDAGHYAFAEGLEIEPMRASSPHRCAVLERLVWRHALGGPTGGSGLRAQFAAGGSSGRFGNKRRDGRPAALGRSGRYAAAGSVKDPARRRMTGLSPH